MCDKSIGYKRTGWTPERRKAQAERIRRLKPWLKSTGPKSEAGKARSSRNAYRHGLRSALYEAQCKLLRHLLRTQKRHCRAYLKANMPNLALCKQKVQLSAKNKGKGKESAKTLLDKADIKRLTLSRLVNPLPTSSPMTAF